MIDARALALLQDVLRRESRSLLQYVREAFPWTTPEERELLAKLRQLTDEERAQLDKDRAALQGRQARGTWNRTRCRRRV